tara:strand:- start:72328 stop:72879 length:552 start_codon:yes stop_codon:yes gene_type:complete
MKKVNVLYLVIGILLTLLALILYPKFLNSNQLAVVNSQKVLEEYKGLAEARDIYELKIKELSEKFESQKQVYESKKKELEILSNQLTKIDKTDKLIELEKYKSILVRLSSEIENQSAIEENQILEGVYNKVNNFIERFGKKNGYDIIFGANGQGSILYVQNKTDITDKIIEELNKEYLTGIDE